MLWAAPLGSSLCHSKRVRVGFLVCPDPFPVGTEEPNGAPKAETGKLGEGKRSGERAGGPHRGVKSLKSVSAPMDTAVLYTPTLTFLHSLLQKNLCLAFF